MIKQMSNLKQRLMVSILGMFILLTAIFFSFHPLFRPLFALFIAASISCALWEFYQIGIAKKFAPLTKLGIACTAVYVMITFLTVQGILSIEFPIITLIAFLLIFCGYYFFKDSDPLINLSLTTFGILYLTIPLTLVLNINYFFPEHSQQDGRWWLIYLLVVTKMTDTGAYFVGKKFGKHKLAPLISPKKTIEGAIAGLFLSLLASLIIYFLTNHVLTTPPLIISLNESIYLGLSIGIIAQVGDLIESLFKRDGGIKDSNQLPGLGGMLDIVDSIIFTTPVVYFFLKLH